MKINTLLILSSLITLSACSNDYTPPKNIDGEGIFKMTCAKCHSPEPASQPLAIFNLAPENANASYIANKVHGGGMTMPKFPNITGDKMQLLSNYVLKHNEKK